MIVIVIVKVKVIVVILMLLPTSPWSGSASMRNARFGKRSKAMLSGEDPLMTT